MQKIVLLEDEIWLGELYHRALTKAGYAVTWCRDNYDTIEALDAIHPDVLVMDLLLPWGNGLQLLHEVASYADLASMPVILCSSALPSDVGIAQLQQYGIVAVVDKTRSQARHLVHTVDEVLSHANVSN